jgi:hypothetical protein
MRTVCWSSLIVLALTATIAGAAEPPKSGAPKSELPKFELRDGDRVVFLGNTLIEREQKYGYWELMLTMAWPERNVTFRNLGWSGDTVWGESRAGFGTQADGFKALVNQVNAAKPTLIFVGYGNVEAFDGEAGLPKFIDGYNKLLDELEKTKARIVALEPVKLGDTSHTDTIYQPYNRVLARYADAINHAVSARNGNYIKSGERSGPKSTIYSTNGMDRDESGYEWLAQLWAEDIGLPSRNLLDRHVPHSLLRQAIIKKNELFFHRWRPQNETYLFGFRKHEQGKNAEELFAFDPLIEAEEKKIAELRVRLAAEMKEANDAK